MKAAAVSKAITLEDSFPGKSALVEEFSRCSSPWLPFSSKVATKAAARKGSFFDKAAAAKEILRPIVPWIALSSEVTMAVVISTEILMYSAP